MTSFLPLQTRISERFGRYGRLQDACQRDRIRQQWDEKGWQNG